MYSPELLQHFENPRRAGELPNATVRVSVQNPVCGDILELCARIEKDVIQAIRFRAQGCVPAMACGSALCDLAEGQTTAAARQISVAALTERVGGVPQASNHATQLALDALRKLIESAR